MDEKINQTIKKNEIQAKDWIFSDLSEQLYIWFDRFNERFFENNLKTPVISFERRRVNNLGHFVIHRNSIGLKWNINLNSRHMDLPLIDKNAVLLHEMTHQWQQEFGKKKGRNKHGNYHNVEFRTKARLMGTPSNQSGVVLEYNDPFLSFLENYGVSLKSQILPDEKDEKEKVPAFKQKAGISKLKKWSCRCTNVRVAVSDFRALCLKCGKKFELCQNFKI